MASHAVWVYHDQSAKNVYIHRSECGNCQDGKGKNPGASYVDSEWIGFSSDEEAVQHVELFLKLPVRRPGCCPG
jgi:hypothetical protein